MPDLPVIIVTGASSGIGDSVSRLFASNGYRVVLAARRLDRLEAIADDIRSNGGQAVAVQTDLGVYEDIQNLVATTIAEFGQVDVLVNNAGFGRLKWLEQLDPVDDIQTQLQINLIATILVAREVLPYMIERRAGHIINMASLGGFIATPTYTIYSASKFGVRGFTEALRREVGIYGIHVSGIYPGGVKTEFKAHTGAERKTGRTTPASLRLEPGEVAQAVLSVVNHPRKTVILPWPMRFAIWINSHFPGLADWIIESRFTRLERDT